MSSKLLRGFRPMKNDVTTGTSKEHRTRPEVNPDGSTKSATVIEDASVKRDRVENRGPSNPVLKRQKKYEGASSFAESQLKLVAPFIKEKELKAWQSQMPKEKNEALIQASMQILFSSIGRAQEIQKEKLQISKLEAEKRKLEENIVANDNKWKKTLDTVNADYAIVSADLQESFEHRDLLKKANDQLQARLDALENEKKAWNVNQEEAEEKIFKDGFDCYLMGFLANDPDYNWEEKFGKETAEDITSFKVLNADKIKEKRIELGLEETPQGAPSKEDASLDSDQVSPKTILNPDIPTTSNIINPKDAPTGIDAPKE